jgi:hypothetical protein
MNSPRNPAVLVIPGLYPQGTQGQSSNEITELNYPRMGVILHSPGYTRSKADIIPRVSPGLCNFTHSVGEFLLHGNSILYLAWYIYLAGIIAPE